ncbi:MAG: DMT family transporter [Phormidesmis sp.]
MNEKLNNQLIAFRPSGRLYLMIAILIFGSASAVIRKLTDLGAQQAMGGHNPISFCNVLFVGNLCALLIMVAIYQHHWRVPALKRISVRQWLTLTLVSILSSAVIPSLIFSALSLTSVNNVILIGQLDAPLALALSIVFLGSRINRWVTVGAALALVGVALTVLIPSATDGSSLPVGASGMGLQMSLGNVLILLAAICKAISNTVSKVSLRQVPLGIFNIYRMLVGTVLFFIVTLVLFDPSHFMDVASPFVWRWMLLYGAVVVLGGQLAWFKGLTMSTPSEISLAAAFNPLAGILAAFLILQELPTRAQYIGGAVILVGILCNQVGIQRLSMARQQQLSQQDLTAPVGFKGV